MIKDEEMTVVIAAAASYDLGLDGDDYYFGED